MHNNCLCAAYQLDPVVDWTCLICNCVGTSSSIDLKTLCVLVLLLDCTAKLCLPLSTPPPDTSGHTTSSVTDGLLVSVSLLAGMLNATDCEYPEHRMQPDLPEIDPTTHQLAVLVCDQNSYDMV